MNRIDLTNIGGFPLEQDTLKFMQDGYGDMFEAIARMCGDKTILTGVEVVGGNVTGGWICYNGEPIKFIGGSAGAGVIIQETAQNALFEDGTTKPVYKTRTATIGSPATFPFSDLKPVNIGVPAGTVLMWSGDVTSIPRGFALCDGTNGTPNLKGKFIVGYDATDTDYNALGKTGGSKTRILNESNLPPLDLPQRTNDVDRGTQGSLFSLDNLVTKGASAPFDIRPPYYTLAYIIKL